MHFMISAFAVRRRGANTRGAVTFASGLTVLNCRSERWCVRALEYCLQIKASM